MAYKDRRQDIPIVIQQYLEEYGETGRDWRNYIDPETQKEWSHIQEHFPPPSSGDEIMDAEIEDLLDAKRRQLHKDSDPVEPLHKRIARMEPLGPGYNIIIDNNPFHMMKKGGQV